MLVTIIIPCYNVADYIAECIESALNQSHANTEIICVDNNSSDDTFNILLEYEKKYPSKIIVTKELKPGAPAARNKGLSLAKGEWIQFLDADDLLLPTKIEHQLKILKTFEDTDIIIGSMLKRFVSNKTILIRLHKANIWEALIKGGAGCTCSNLYKKNALIDIKGWREDRLSSQEAYLLFDLLMAGRKTLFDEEPLTVIRERIVGSISSSAKKENWVRYIQLRIEIWIYLAENKILSAPIEYTLKQVIFDSIRSLYKMDQKKAIELHNLAVENSFEPVLSRATTPLYLSLYKVLGFATVQKFKKPF